MLVFDNESNGLLPGQCATDAEITKLHCVNLIDRVTGREYRFTDHAFYQNVEGGYTDERTPRDGTINDALVMLQRADCIGGHNVIGYDIPAQRYLYPWWNTKARVLDSQTLANIVHPYLKDKDWSRIRKGKLPDTFKQHAGRNSLWSWGVRLGGDGKIDFDPKNYGHTWKTMPFTKDMDDYCMQDVRLNVRLFESLEAHPVDTRSIALEMGTAKIIKLQERTGVAFDSDAANDLAQTLYARQYELQQECRSVFPPFYKKDGKEKTFKKNMVRKVAGKSHKEWCSGTHQPVKLVDFNPGSRQHISICLRKKYAWEPTEFTNTGLDKIDEEVLGALPFPEVQKIAEFMTVQKRLSQLSEGKQAWMKKVNAQGRIHGRVDQLGTVTGRMSHFQPNLAQVPKCGSPYGQECRSLFVADAGRTLVGCDADALELRVLAHFMARFDGGAYVSIILNGSKETGDDIHTRNRITLGLDSRDVAKTWFYAMLYGSGDFNLGTIVLTDWTAEKLAKFYKVFPPGKKRQAKIAAIGKRARSALMASLPALAQLVDKVKESAKRGWLKGLDGRRIPVRSAHAALNSLCQSAGAVIMKQALVIMFEQFEREGLDVLPLLNVHDEVQLSVLPEEAQRVGTIAADSIRLAGEHFAFRCPLAGDFDIGATWAETH